MNITPLGHCGFVIECKNSAVLVDPNLTNKNFPKEFSIPYDKVKAVLVTHGHGSHIGNSVQICKDNRIKLFAVHEVSLYAQQKGLPAELAVGMNFGGTVDFPEGWEVTLLQVMHSSWYCNKTYLALALKLTGMHSCNDGKIGELLPGGGIAGSWMITTPAKECIYHSGDTNIFSDLKLFNDIWKPEVAILSIGGHYCMGPKLAAYAIDNLLTNVNVVIPWSSCFAAAKFPVRKGKVKEILPHLSRTDVQVIDLEAGTTHIYKRSSSNEFKVPHVNVIDISRGLPAEGVKVTLLTNNASAITGEIDNKGDIKWDGEAIIQTNSNAKLQLRTKAYFNGNGILGDIMIPLDFESKVMEYIKTMSVILSPSSYSFSIQQNLSPAL